MQLWLRAYRPTIIVVCNFKVKVVARLHSAGPDCTVLCWYLYQYALFETISDSVSTRLSAPLSCTFFSLQLQYIHSRVNKAQSFTLRDEALQRITAPAADTLAHDIGGGASLYIQAPKRLPSGGGSSSSDDGVSRVYCR